jgi:hypothetical protein
VQLTVEERKGRGSSHARAMAFVADELIFRWSRLPTHPCIELVLDVDSQL